MIISDYHITKKIQYWPLCPFNKITQSHLWSTLGEKRIPIWLKLLDPTTYLINMGNFLRHASNMSTDNRGYNDIVWTMFQLGFFNNWMEMGKTRKERGMDKLIVWRDTTTNCKMNLIGSWFKEATEEIYFICANCKSSWYLMIPKIFLFIL